MSLYESHRVIQGTSDMQLHLLLSNDVSVYAKFRNKWVWDTLSYT